MHHWPLSQIWKIKQIAEYIKLGLKIMEKQALLSAVKRWGLVSLEAWEPFVIQTEETNISDSHSLYIESFSFKI